MLAKYPVIKREEIESSFRYRVAGLALINKTYVHGSNVSTKHGFSRVHFVHLRRRANFITYAAILAFSDPRHIALLLEKENNFNFYWGRPPLKSFHNILRFFLPCYMQRAVSSYLAGGGIGNE